MPRFEASALRGYCVSVLTASGVERSCAEAVADALIDAELTGVSTHGVSRLAVYMQRMDAGVMSRENNIRIVRESTSTLVVDAATRWARRRQNLRWSGASPRQKRRAAALQACTAPTTSAPPPIIQGLLPRRI